ncbi:MAG: DUF6056 family protein [Flavobacteriales bacterium]
MTRRSIELLVLFFLLILLARHAWVAAYIHPYADDLTYAVKGRESVLLERLDLEYRYWNGRYFSNILVLRNPIILGMERGLPLYRLIPIVLMLLTVSAAYMALRSALPAMLSRLRSLLVALSFLVLYIHLMPHAGEGLYWYTGAVTYLLPCIFMLLNVAVLFRWMNSSRMMRTALTCISALLIAAAVGSNEVAMVHVLLVQAAALGLWWKSDLRSLLIGLLLWSIACAALVYFAPGNAVRETYFINTHDPLRTVTYSVAQTIRFGALWMLSPAFLLATVLVMQWGRGLSVYQAFKVFLLRVPRWVMLALPVLAIVFGMALPYWGTGILGQHRTVNAALFVFLPLAWLALLVWDAQVFQTRGWRLIPESRALRCSALAVIGLSLMFLRQDSAVTTDLWNGSLARYDAQCMDRYVQVQEAIRSGDEILELQLFRDPPRSLKLLDIQRDPEHFMNRGLVLYFEGGPLQIHVQE